MKNPILNYLTQRDLDTVNHRRSDVIHRIRTTEEASDDACLTVTDIKALFTAAERMLKAYEANTGAEPSVSNLSRAADDLKSVLYGKSAEWCPGCDPDNCSGCHLPVVQQGPLLGPVRIPGTHAMLYWRDNEVGGRTYFSDEVGDGLWVWDTSLVSEASLKEAMRLESKFEGR